MTNYGMEPDQLAQKLMTERKRLQKLFPGKHNEAILRKLPFLWADIDKERMLNTHTIDGKAAEIPEEGEHITRVPFTMPVPKRDEVEAPEHPPLNRERAYASGGDGSGERVVIDISEL
jgi:hypothetical protein